MGGPARTVLVVEDEQAIRLLCRVNLELEGYDVLEAATLADARLLLERGGIDIVLLDVHLGSDDGWTLVDELRDAESEARIALLTGSVDIAPAEAARIDAVVRKPFSLDRLLTTVADLAEAGARTA